MAAKCGIKCGTKCAVILAGGQSRRFGSDKTALTRNGQLLLAPLVEMLRTEGFEVTLLGPLKPHLETLNCRILPDTMPHEGPLPAIAGALSRLDAKHLLVVAADMPFLTREVVRLLWNAGSHFATPSSLVGEGRACPEPSRRGEGKRAALTLLDCAVLPALTRLEGAVLPAIYAQSALPTMMHLIETSTRRLQNLHAVLHPHVLTIPAAEWHAADPHHHSLTNINMPEEWDKRCQINPARIKEIRSRRK